jgi:hypothetical protein
MEYRKWDILRIKLISSSIIAGSRAGTTGVAIDGFVIKIKHNHVTLDYRIIPHPLHSSQ